MPTAYELILAQDWSKNRAGKQTGRRRFVVDDVNPASALLAPGIPAVNSEHPDLPNLRLDRYQVSSQTDGTCTVDCEYSNDSRFVDLRQPNKDDPTWYHWGWAQRKVMVEIPICIRSLVIADGLSGQISKKVWKIAKKQVPETRVVRPLNVRVQITNVRDFDIIAEQTDKLHFMPDGKAYRFEGASVSQVDDEGYYDISYTWEYDQGTNYLPDTGNADVVYPTVLSFGIPIGPLRRREPYTVLGAYQVGNPETDVPTADQQPLYAYGNRTAGNDNDGLGWQLLPGANRII